MVKDVYLRPQAQKNFLTNTIFRSANSLTARMLNCGTIRGLNLTSPMVSRMPRLLTTRKYLTHLLP